MLCSTMQKDIHKVLKLTHLKHFLILLPKVLGDDRGTKRLDVIGRLNTSLFIYNQFDKGNIHAIFWTKLRYTILVISVN